MQWRTLRVAFGAICVTLVLTKVTSCTARCVIGTPAQQAVDVGDLFPSMLQAVNQAYAASASRGETISHEQDDLVGAVANAWWHFYLCTAERGLETCRTVASADSPAAELPDAYMVRDWLPGLGFSLSFLPEGQYDNEWAEIELRVTDEVGTTQFSVWLDWQDCSGTRVPATIRNAFIEETR